MCFPFSLPLQALWLLSALKIRAAHQKDELQHDLLLYWLLQSATEECYKVWFSMVRCYEIWFNSLW